MKRISYDQWRNSQLSIARFSGGININWEQYEFDINEMKKLNDPNVSEVFPDLVLYSKK